jgi:RNA polymerase subunit RPABC4/transcription elongation factor Spt4
MSKYCSNCGSKISEGASFCGDCGEKVILLDIENNVCSNCDYSTNLDEKYCPECGEILSNLKKQTELKEEEINKPTENIYKKVVESTVNKPIYSKKNDKPGCFKKLFKTFLWIVGFLVVGLTVLYFIGDTEGNQNINKTRSQVEPEQTISDEAMRFPSEKVRQANPKLTETIAFEVLPTSQSQKYSYSDNITISLPPNFTNLNQTLSVSKATVDPSILIENKTPLILVDLSLKNNKQPIKPVEISYTYNKSDLDPNYSAEEQLDAFRWDEEGGGWVSLPIHIDEENNTVSAIVDHFSIPGFFIKTHIVGVIGEKLLNDVYMTPKNNFKILYSKKAILADQDLNTSNWKKAPTGRTSANKSNAPEYIQAIGYLLEEALESYTSRYHFKNPAGIHKGYIWNYQKTITVKVDSWFSVVTGGNASYEKIYERLHIPTVQAFNYEPTKITLAHELFHRIQAEYYGVSGMFRGANQWWLEATAEYAAYSLAYPTKQTGMSKGCGTNYLNFPLNDRGEKKGTGYGWTEREYQYVTAIWIDYLVENGSNLQDMIEYDAADYYMPEFSLDKYLYKTHKKSMPDFYREFANWMVFSPKGHLYKYPNLTSGGENDRDIAIQNSTLLLLSKDEKSYNFAIPEKYSSQLWGITIGESNSTKSAGKTPVIIEVKDKSPGITIDVFCLPKMQSNVDPKKPIYTFYTDNENKMILVEEGEALCIVTTQGRVSGGGVEVIVRSEPVKLEIEPSELVDAVGNKPYLFKFKASDIPKEIENVKFEWDFSDNSKKSQGFTLDIPVSGGEAKNEVEHIYKSNDKEEKFPLKVLLKDSKTGIILASVVAPVVLPIAKPTVFITERHLIGPPGATFDVTAKASPKDTYNFKWYIQGMSNSYTYQGEESTFKPVAKKLGKYNVNVKLYNLKNEFLSEDNVTIYVEELNVDNIDGIVDIDTNNETKIGAWVLKEIIVEDNKSNIQSLNESWKGRQLLNVTHLQNSEICKITSGNEVLEVKFNWTDPPKIIKHNGNVSLKLQASTIKNTIGRYDFPCNALSINAYAEVKNVDNDYSIWSSGIQDKKGTAISTLFCDKYDPSWDEVFYLNNFPKGKENEILSIGIYTGGCFSSKRFTKYNYEWK